MTSNQSDGRLEKFFAGLAENTFQTHLGVADPQLIDYVSGLLIRSVRLEPLNSIRGVDGTKAKDISEMVVEAKHRLGDARRRIHLQIGDFALFWAGLFPESLRRKSRYARVDQYTDYCNHGKRAYQIASTIDSSDEETPPNEVLERLSERFELCAYGLREVRREWERRDDDPDAPRPILFN